MNQLRALLVGAGAWGQNWAPTLERNDDVDLVGWVDLNVEAVERAAQGLGRDDLHVGSSLEQAIERLHPDFVVDVAAPEAHHAVTLQALGMGVPVLGEKPMADSMDHARDLVEASERAGKLFMVSQSRRYDPRAADFRELIQACVGPLGILDSGFYLGPHDVGFRKYMESPLLLDMAIHTLDTARYLSNADPVAVYCDEFNPPWSWYKGNASAVAVFEMTEGLRYIYRGSWCAEGFGTAWEAEWRAVGPHGTAIWDGTSAPVADMVIEQGDEFARTEHRTSESERLIQPGIGGALRDFVHALRTGETPMGECHDNIKSLAMVFGAIASTTSGRRIEIEV